MVTFKAVCCVTLLLTIINLYSAKCDSFTTNNNIKLINKKYKNHGEKLIKIPSSGVVKVTDGKYLNSVPTNRLKNEKFISNNKIYYSGYNTRRDSSKFKKINEQFRHVPIVTNLKKNRVLRQASYPGQSSLYPNINSQFGQPRNPYSSFPSSFDMSRPSSDFSAIDKSLSTRVLDYNNPNDPLYNFTHGIFPSFQPTSQRPFSSFNQSQPIHPTYYPNQRPPYNSSSNPLYNHSNSNYPSSYPAGQIPTYNGQYPSYNQSGSNYPSNYPAGQIPSYNSQYPNYNQSNSNFSSNYPAGQRPSYNGPYPTYNQYNSTYPSNYPAAGQRPSYNSQYPSYNQSNSNYPFGQRPSFNNFNPSLNPSGQGYPYNNNNPHNSFGQRPSSAPNGVFPGQYNPSGPPGSQQFFYFPNGTLYEPNRPQYAPY